MPDSIWSNWAGNRALAHNFGAHKWLALHQSNPFDGDTASEVAGGDYHRRLIDWSVPSGRKLANISTPVFSAMPACTVRWLAVWTMPSGGDMIAKQLLPEPLVVVEDGKVVMARHDIAWEL